MESRLLIRIPSTHPRLQADLALKWKSPATTIRRPDSNCNLYRSTLAHCRWTASARLAQKQIQIPADVVTARSALPSHGGTSR